MQHDDDIYDQLDSNDELIKRSSYHIMEYMNCSFKDMIDCLNKASLNFNDLQQQLREAKALESLQKNWRELADFRYNENHFRYFRYHN